MPVPFPLLGVRITLLSAVQVANTNCMSHGGQCVSLLFFSKLRTQEAHEFSALDREGLGHDQDTLVATLRTKHGQTNP